MVTFVKFKHFMGILLDIIYIGDRCNKKLISAKSSCVISTNQLTVLKLTLQNIFGIYKMK